MIERRRWSTLTVACLCVAMAANGVQAQSDPESEPGGAAIREGWVLVSGAEPPFSLALPPGWSQGAAADDSLALATSDAGSSLVLASGEAPAEADFDAYVTGVEKRLEKQRKGDVPTVLRMAPTGLVARLELAPGKRQEASEHSALFLFPACEDGVRSLTVSGVPPLPAEGGAPDEWDLIAAAVNPCSADPAPQGIEDPALAELAGAYFALATDVNGTTDPIIRKLEAGGAVSRWTRTAARLGAVYEEASPRLLALPWTAETQPLGDALHAAYQGLTDLFGERLARARNAKAITSSWDDIDAAFAALTAAGRAIRLAVGLPTVAR